jgi:basic membrane protein A
MKNVRIPFLLTLLAALVVILAACPAAPPATAPAAPGDGEAPAVEFRVGLVTDVGRINDRSFNQSAWEGVLLAAEQLGISANNINFIETTDPTDYADNMAQFLESDYNVIVTVGFALGEATIVAARENPDVFFIGVDQFQGEALPNLAGLIFEEDKSGFLAGVLAAQMTQSNIIASVLGTDLVPPVVAFGTGYANGARYINPDISVITTYHPGGLDIAFTDPEWGAATAAQAMDQGADVVFAAGGLTGNGGLQEVASRVTADAPVYCIGVDTDQWFTVPAAQACLISSAMKLITPGVADLIGLAQAGDFPGGNYLGGVGLAPFHDFDDVIPQEVKDILSQVGEGLEDGSISTGY